MEAAIAAVRRRDDGANWSRGFPADPPPVSADPVLLETVLVNVLDNAVKHGGGAIRIRAEERMGAVQLVIEDDGPGIPAGLLAHVFDRFTRAHEPAAAPGAGLGLSICKGLIEAMGGTIALQSPTSAGTGTRVLITLTAGAPPMASGEEAR